MQVKSGEKLQRGKSRRNDAITHGSTSKGNPWYAKGVSRAKISADSRADAIIRWAAVVQIHRCIYQPLCIAALASVILITSVMHTAAPSTLGAD